MIQRVVSDFPPIEAAYDEEFGKVDPIVYQAAKTLWLHAEQLAVELLRDSHKGVRLMLKAVVNVSRARETCEIKNLSAYLYRAYKNLVLAELEKENGRQRLLSERYFEIEIADDAEERLNRKILINELRRQMDDWTRKVFDYLCLGYSFENLAPQYGSAANVIRARYSKNAARLAREIQAKIEIADRNVYKL